jgi:hypothetical protein
MNNAWTEFLSLPQKDGMRNGNGLVEEYVNIISYD